MSDEILGRIGGNSKKRSGSRRPQLADPMAGVTRDEVTRTTVKKSRQAGQYIRMTFTLFPDQIHSVETIAEALGVSQMELARWFFDLGVRAVEDGVRPEFETSQQKRIVRDV